MKGLASACLLVLILGFAVGRRGLAKELPQEADRTIKQILELYLDPSRIGECRRVIARNEVTSRAYGEAVRRLAPSIVSLANLPEPEPSSVRTVARAIYGDSNFVCNVAFDVIARRMRRSARDAERLRPLALALCRLWEGDEAPRLLKLSSSIAYPVGGTFLATLVELLEGAKQTDIVLMTALVTNIRTEPTLTLLYGTVRRNPYQAFFSDEAATVATAVRVDRKAIDEMIARPFEGPSSPYADLRRGLYRGGP